MSATWEKICYKYMILHVKHSPVKFMFIYLQRDEAEKALKENNGIIESAVSKY